MDESNVKWSDGPPNWGTWNVELQTDFVWRTKFMHVARSKKQLPPKCAFAEVPIAEGRLFIQRLSSQSVAAAGPGTSARADARFRGCYEFGDARFPESCGKSPVRVYYSKGPGGPAEVEVCLRGKFALIHVSRDVFIRNG